MRKPAEFLKHPASFDLARSKGCYRVAVTYVTDGDTFDCMIDMGLGHYAYESVRLRGIDTPEIFSPETQAEKEHGLKAKVRVEELILNRGCLIRTYRDSASFGRYVADTYYPMYENDGSVVWIDLASTLRVEGWNKLAYYT